jgi:IS4 transposase
VTTLPKAQASTHAILHLGHRRWGIENEGFNELVNQYHADHVYRHEPTAMLVFWLLTQLCLNVFTAFFRRNLKPAARAAMSMLHVARRMLAELYRPQARAPT